MSRKPGAEFHGLVASHIWWQWTLFSSNSELRVTTAAGDHWTSQSSPRALTSSSGSLSLPSHALSMLSLPDSPGPLLSMWKGLSVQGAKGGIPELGMKC